MPEVESIAELKQQIDEHIQEYNEHRAEEAARWERLIDAQEANARSIGELAKSTSDIVTAWQAINGTMSVVGYVGKGVKWLSGFAFIGVGLAAIYDKFNP